jgi:uncharacterized protein (DUF1800 family)
MARSTRHLIAHLLRRAGFGAGPAELEEYTALGFEGAVDRLVNYESVDNGELEAVVQRMRANNPPYVNPEKPELGNLGLEIAIWLTRMLLTKRPLQEKMTLFWHGHFTSSSQAVHYADLLYRQNELFRANALTTDFKQMTKAVARDPAMLIYLDNRSNIRGKPNENWARELMELFTLGIGNYTETDVKEAARAFTGWTLDRNRRFYFRTEWHDYGTKTFLGITGNLNGDDIIDIIFNQPAHGPFIARRLFRFFVYDDPDSATITRLADVYVKSGFNVKALMRQILLSPEFRSDRAMFALVKSPVEFTIGALRALSARIEDVTLWKAIAATISLMGQQLYNPPNVGGWPGGRNWINSSTYLTRANMARQLVSIENNATIDPTEIAASAGITTPQAAVDYFLELLVQSDVPVEYRNILNRFAGPRFTSRRDADAKLRGLVRLIMSSPAYQMN